MIFFQLPFVAGLLAASILFWAVVPAPWRKAFLVVASCGALLTIQPGFTLILFALIAATHALSLSIRRGRPSPGRLLLSGLLLLVSFLLAAKYGGLLLAVLFSPEHELAKSYLVPLGVSYLSFKLIAFVIDVYRGTIEKPRFWDLVAFIFFIPTFPAGPIERYQDFAAQRTDTLDPALYIDGLRRLVLGYFKKVVLVSFLLQETVIRGLEPEVMSLSVSADLPGWKVLLFLVGALFYAYFDLSAYADIAIGYGQLFGIRTIENMNYPVFRRNLSDYWANWHISLSSWCRNNVYFPVLGATRRNNLALMASFIVMGLWHNISLNWVIWGIWHATGIIIYSRYNRFLRKRKRLKRLVKGKAGYAFGMTLTVLYSSLGFAFIMTDSRTDLLSATEQAVRILLAIFF